MNKAEEDTKKSKIRDKILKEMEDKVKREHVKIMKQQKTEIKQVAKALKGYTKSFEIKIKNNKDPLKQLQKTIKVIEKHIDSILTSMKGLKFVQTLRVTSIKFSNGEIVRETSYFNSKPQTITDKTQRLQALQLSEQEILNMIAQGVSKGSGWIIESVNNHYLNIVKYLPLNPSSYIQLPVELRHHMKGLINMKNEDNECFRWCHIRRLNPQG